MCDRSQQAKWSRPWEPFWSLRQLLPAPMGVQRGRSVRTSKDKLAAKVLWGENPVFKCFT